MKYILLLLVFSLSANAELVISTPWTVGSGTVSLASNIVAGVTLNAANATALTNLTSGNITGAVAEATHATNSDNSTLAGSVSGLGTNTFSKAAWTTNNNTTTPNFAVAYSELTTNAAFTFLAPSNVSTTNYQSCVIIVTNSTGSVVAMTNPAGVRTNGIWNVTNVSVVTFFNCAGRFTNAIAIPLF
jgi:hypothetical protein